MIRSIEIELEAWAKKPNRKPLIIRGARQVGKSYIVQNNLAKKFHNIVTVNFERQPEYKSIFEDSLDPKKIISDISALSRSQINKGKTLLFFDEIQESPKAITSLRYFQEEMPELAIVGAGSLLEFAISPQSSAPVGRVEYAYLGPMTFEEFLMNSGGESLLEALKIHNFELPFSTALHNMAISYLIDYLAVGGLPAAVAEYISSRDLNAVEQIQSNLLTSYQDDIPKYAFKRKELEYIQLVYRQLPGLVGKQFKYSQIAKDVRSTYIQEAIDALVKAGIIQQAFKANELPLGASRNLKRYKMFFIDIGLLQRALGMNLASWRTEKAKLVHTGAIAEQYVAQQLTSLIRTKRQELYYWERDKKGSSAEIDFLVEAKSKKFPIEVKAGARGHLKSLLGYLEAHKEVKEGFKISLDNFGQNQNIKNIPLYAIHEWCRRIEYKG